MTDFLTEDDRKNPALVAAMEDFKTAGGPDALSVDLVSLSARVETYDPDDIRDDSGEPTIDCRLRYHDREFYFLTGDASYDQDHRGHWGASCVGVDLTEDEARSIARDLVEQVLDSVAQADWREL
jgi:hypothetical protein